MSPTSNSARRRAIRAWQRAIPVATAGRAQAFARQARAASHAHQSGLKAQGAMDAITDVSASTVEATFARLASNG